jgi:hypothetical protein
MAIMQTAQAIYTVLKETGETVITNNDVRICNEVVMAHSKTLSKNPEHIMENHKTSKLKKLIIQVAVSLATKLVYVHRKRPCYSHKYQFNIVS